MEQTEPMNARQVVASHVQWKIALQFAIAMRENLSEEQHRQIRQPTRCPIGRWMDGAMARKHCASPEYGAMYQAHLEFHVEMQRVATCIQEGRFEAASALVETPGCRYLESANRLANSIMALDRLEPLIVRR